MTQDQATLSPVSLDCEPVWPLVPVLIQVPEVAPARSTREARQYCEATRTAVRRRRRLRREIRLGGTVALMLTPLAWGLLMLCGGDTEPPCARAQLMGVEGIGPAFVSTDDSGHTAVPVVPALTAPRPQGGAEGPIVLPNYILPDDGSEEPSHAGG